MKIFILTSILLFLFSSCFLNCKTNHQSKETRIKVKTIANDSSIKEYSIFTIDNKLKNRFIKVDNVNEGYYMTFDEFGVIESSLFYDFGEEKLFIASKKQNMLEDDSKKIDLEYIYGIPLINGEYEIIGELFLNENSEVDEDL